MARKSAAALAVVQGGGRADARIPPPSDLSETEAELWSEIVDSKPADWFDVDSAPVLKEYVRAIVTCDQLARVVGQALNGAGMDLKTALDMRDKEARRLTSLATKLRLTQQSQYTAKSAATANRRAAGKRPWEK